MENKKEIIRLDIGSELAKPYIVFSIIWWIVSIIVFICALGMIVYWCDIGFALPVILGIIIVFGLPIFIRQIDKFVANRCLLTLEEDQLVGSLRMPFSTKAIQMPIEKLDNVFITHSIWDSLRGGDTVCVHSNSGVVRFHYVYNAKEFAELAVKQIEKYKGNISKVQPTSVVQKDSSISEKIQELQKLKEMGVLSEEEFEAKRKDLIAKL